MAQAKPTRLTTIGAMNLFSKLKLLKEAKLDYLVLEVTSHALAQHRVYGVPFEVVVLTNMSHEHLDYHKTFERYVDAKRLLFKQANRNKKGLRTGLINAEDQVAPCLHKILISQFFTIEPGSQLQLK